MLLIPLGTNGYFPSFGRQTMAILVLDGETALLLDAGVEVVALSGKEWNLGRMPVRMRRQAHPGGSVGIRLGDRLAYCVDAAIDPGAIEFLAGAEVLLHEVRLIDEEAAREPPERSGHSAGQVAALAASAGVERLFPVHHHPKRSESELERLVQGMRREGIIIELPQEGAVLRLGKDPADA